MNKECKHVFMPCAYNQSIVIEVCQKCGEEAEFDFDEYCANYGFPVIDEDEEMENY